MKTTSDFDNRTSGDMIPYLESRIEAMRRCIDELVKGIPPDEAMKCLKCEYIHRRVSECPNCGGDVSLLSAHLEAVRLHGLLRMDRVVVKVERE